MRSHTFRLNKGSAQAAGSALPPKLSGKEAIKLVRVRPRAHAGALAMPRAAGHVPIYIVIPFILVSSAVGGKK